MDAKGKFFSRMDANLDTDRALWPGKEEVVSDSELDIDFSFTESGRTVAHMVVEQYGSLDQVDESPLDDMEFSVTSSDRTVEHVNSQLSERSGASTISNGSDNNDQRAAAAAAATHAKDRGTSNYSSNLSSSISNSNNASLNASNAQQHHQQGHPFQPLLPLPEHRQRSAPRAIPSAAPQQQVVPPPILGPPSLPNSAGSTGSAFLNNLLSPAASTFSNTHLSHTPPTHMATSYEASHFAKRARSGVSQSQVFRFSGLGLRVSWLVGVLVCLFLGVLVCSSMIDW
jgi:hypothetical protein